MTDLELLAEYARTRSDDAFAAIVERYVRLVHSACWRQMGDAQLAEDATQMVFVLLSKKAARLRHAELAGWLLTTARYTCANMKRAEMRRVRREGVMAMNPIQNSISSNSELLQMLDEGLLRLGAEDRQALVLRFLNQEPLRAVGEALGLSEDAARKRVERGVAKLRRFFADCGVTTDSAALAAVMADQSHVPPMGHGLTPRILHAAKLQPGAGLAAMRPEVAIGGSILICAAVGIAGWGLMKGAPPPPPVAQMATTPVAAAAAAEPAPAPAAAPTAAAAPADAPALDRSTPDNTLTSIARALAAADRPGMESCLLKKSNGPKTLIDASMDWGLAHSQVAQEAKKTYGPDGARMFQDPTSFPAVLQGLVVMRRLQGESAQITGNTARITTEIPAPILQSAPAEAQQLLLQWSGKPVYFELRDGAWLLDVNRSIRLVMKVQKRNNGPLLQAGDAANIAYLEADATVLDSISAQVEQGQLPLLADFQTALNAAQNRVREQYSIFGVQTFVAPAIPTARQGDTR